MGALRQSLGLFQGPKSYEPLAPEHPGEPGEIESASANITVVKLTQLECQINGKTLVAIDREVTVRPGEMVAIVGQSGAGKSSLLKVFAGLICPTQFRGTLSWQAFASHTSYISQQAFLFTGVVAENLLYGVEDKDVSLQEAYELSVALGLDSLIKNAAQLKTMRIDALKGSVSGGELQRLTIVRGLLRNKKILLFDEASSALDLRNEERLLQLLQKRCQSLGLMCFYVTHRLQPIHPFQQVWHIDRHRLASVEICP
jgi:ABC-type transport system involved in cytochrome bd biosynthesis fused ATPase/permease subunit